MEWEWIGKAGEEGNPVWPLDSVQMLSLGGLLSGTPGGGGAVECDLCSRLPSATEAVRTINIFILTASVAVRNQIIRGELCGNGPSNATTGSHLPLKFFSLKQFA